MMNKLKNLKKELDDYLKPYEEELMALIAK